MRAGNSYASYVSMLCGGQIEKEKKYSPSEKPDSFELTPKSWTV